MTVSDSNVPVVQQSDVIVLAVKPQSMRGVLENLRTVVTPDHLVVSVAAGITIASITQGLSPGVRVVRVMPNTPALIGEGASAYALGPGVRPEDEALVKEFLDSVGHTVGVAEPLLDAVTGLSGSGPAFVYLMIEALSDGGVRVGLPREVATLLAAQTVLGAARMVRDTGEHPGVLKDQVASPGGTTIAGPSRPGAGGFARALIDAVEAATRRSAELAALAGPRARSLIERGPAMKLGLISDIHGDPVALELAWSHLTVMGADRIVCAGDLVGYGPFPDRVVTFLRERQVASVRGNHDRWALERGASVRDEFGGGTPSTETLEFLRELPFDLLVEHQTDDRCRSSTRRPAPTWNLSPAKAIRPAVLRGYLHELQCELLVVGHTHQPMWFRCPDGLVVNPGSVVSGARSIRRGRLPWLISGRST